MQQPRKMHERPTRGLVAGCAIERHFLRGKDDIAQTGKQAGRKCRKGEMRVAEGAGLSGPRLASRQRRGPKGR
ncbi:hypothetical protein MRX96_001202 [Rhipicephalus microplus]